MNIQNYILFLHDKPVGDVKLPQDKENKLHLKTINFFKLCCETH